MNILRLIFDISYLEAAASTAGCEGAAGPGAGAGGDPGVKPVDGLGEGAALCTLFSENAGAAAHVSAGVLQSWLP